MELLGKLISLSNKYEASVINLRRKIHENPELSFKEYNTSALVVSELEKLGLYIEKGIAKTGVLGILEGYEKGKTILIRADMDALPIEEDLDIEFKSKNSGIMHACGHDVHTANLLGVAKILSDLKDEFKGTIIFVFQPGEERGGGCKKMIDEGILKNRKIHAALGLHIMPIEEGKILLSKGNITAYSDGFTIKVFGKSAHTSKPQDGIDAINIAAHIIVSLNTIISKHLDPRDAASFSIGKIHGGRSNNIVPDYVELSGMIRSTTKESRHIIQKKLKSISMEMAQSFGGSAEVEIRQGYPSIVNNHALVDKVLKTFKENYHHIIKDINDNFNKDNLNEYIIDHKPLLTADDFGFLSQLLPSLYFIIGSGDFAPQHSSKFFVNESYIKLCMRTMTLAALALLD